jgi:hypothetical protein
MGAIYQANDAEGCKTGVHQASISNFKNGLLVPRLSEKNALAFDRFIYLISH